MKRKPHIQKPCSENFFEMKSNKVGKFCDKCKKNVVDIRNTNSFEINNDTSTCIFAHRSQLRAPFTLKQLASGAMIATSTLALNACNDTPNSTIKTENNLSKKEQVSIMKGKVTSGFLNMSGIENVQIDFIKIDTVISTKSDKNGHFELTIPTHLLENKNLFNLRHLEHQYSSKEILLDYDKNKKLQFSLDRIKDDDVTMGLIMLPLEDEDEDSESSSATYINGKRATNEELTLFSKTDTISVEYSNHFTDAIAQHLTKNDSIKEVTIILTKK